MSHPEDTAIWLWATQGVQSGFAAAYAEFRQNLLQAIPGPDAVAELSSLHAAYLEALGRMAQAQAPDQTLQQTGAAYAGALHRIFGHEQARSAVSAAFDRYIHALKDAWTRLDPAAVQAADLAVIAHSIAWVASVSGELRVAGKPDG